MESTNSKLSQDGHSSDCPYEHLCSERFFNLIVTNLQNQVMCLNSKGKHKYSFNCKKRLETLSAILDCFSYCQDKRSKQITNECHNSSKNKSIVIENGNNLEQICSEPCNGESRVPQESGILDSVDDWYRKTCDKFADDDFLIKLIHLQESGQCLFASHIIKKIVCSCTVMYDKTSKVLYCIENKWKRIKIAYGNELDIINSMLSSKPNGDEHDLRKQVYNWFLESKSFYFLSTFVHKSPWSIRDIFQKNMLWLSVLGKLLKYNISCGQEIPVHLGSIAVDILESHEEIFFSLVKLNPFMGQFLLLKFMKIGNKYITAQFCSGQVIPCEIRLKFCVKILKCFPSILEMCAVSGYTKTIAFWGEKYNSEAKQSVSQTSQPSDVVMVREMFLLAVKAAAVLVSTDYAFKDELVSVRTVWECFQSWMKQHYEDEDIQSGWIPSLLGDQDDKWIEALLCLLLIYKEHSHKPQYKEQSTIFKDPSTNDVSCIEPCVFWDSICPHRLFLQFMEFIYFDPIVVSDFLMSPETNFLEYFTKYLVYLKTNWESFVSFCSSWNKHVKINASSDHHESATQSLLEKKRMQHNQNEHMLGDRLNVFQSKKRKYCDDSGSFLSSKKTKTKTINSVRSLVSYTDTDSDSSEDFTDKTIPSSSLLDYEHGSNFDESEKLGIKKTLLLSEFASATQKENNVLNASFDNVVTVSVFNEDLSMHTEHVRALDTNTNNFSNFSSPASSSCSLSDEHENATFSGDDSECNDHRKTGFHVEHTLERVMTMFIRLRFHIERLNSRQLFPYNTDFLLSLLHSSEDKYENM